MKFFYLDVYCFQVTDDVGIVQKAVATVLKGNGQFFVNAKRSETTNNLYHYLPASTSSKIKQKSNNANGDCLVYETTTNGSLGETYIIFL